ncbi:hypothetical protein [Achromobacter ruhlandii]|uniref:hypothetical protein n=1 Tax=Achromobacter ruhlandii TaxID=72557 RepID=UPI0012E7FCC0|nr:hypothetical protein [Achromobacter ruhlandii]
MKLRGTYTELAIRDELIASDMSIKKNESIMRFLRKNYGNIDSAYVFTCTPGEDEDIYEILINGGFVVHFEVDRVSGTICEVEKNSVFDYSRKLRGRLRNLEMLVALDLANAH